MSSSGVYIGGSPARLCAAAAAAVAGEEMELLLDVRDVNGQRCGLFPVCQTAVFTAAVVEEEDSSVLVCWLSLFRVWLHLAVLTVGPRLWMNAADSRQGVGDSCTGTASPIR